MGIEISAEADRRVICSREVTQSDYFVVYGIKNIVAILVELGGVDGTDN